MELGENIMPALDRSRPARMALALFGLVGAGVLGLLLGVVREAGWLSLIFALAFALALLLEIAGGWEENDSSISAKTVARGFACRRSDHLSDSRISRRMGGGPFRADFLSNLATR